MLELRRRTAHHPTERLINKLIRMFVETGTLTGVCTPLSLRTCLELTMAGASATLAIVTLALCLRMPGTQYYETTSVILPLHIFHSIHSFLSYALSGYTSLLNSTRIPSLRTSSLALSSTPAAVTTGARPVIRTTRKQAPIKGTQQRSH